MSLVGRHGIFVVFAVAVLVVISGCAMVSPQGPTSESNGSASSGTAEQTAQMERMNAPDRPTLANVSVREDGDFEVGERTEVHVTLTATRSLSNVTVTSNDVFGYSVDSDPKRVDSVASGETITYSVVVTPRREVVRTLTVRIEAEADGSRLSQRFAHGLETSTTSTSSATTVGGSTNSAPLVTNGTRTSANSDGDDNETSVTTSSASSSEVTLTGVAGYTVGDEFRGLSGSYVEVYDHDGGPTHLATVTTAQDGSFSATLDPSNDADGDGTIDARIFVYTENDGVSVGSSSDSVYGMQGDATGLSSGDTYDFGEFYSSGEQAPYQAADWGYEAYNYARNNGANRDKLQILYPHNDWAVYRYRYGSSDERIELPDRSYYYWDQSTVHHEYGHAVHASLTNWNLPRGGDYNCHAVVSETDPQYAIVEGFAEYYSGAVTDNPDAVTWDGQDLETNQFYDHNYTGDCANGDASGDYDGLSVEGSVASILWDVTDGGSSDDDSLEYDFAAVADVMEENPDSIGEFYRYWRYGDRDALDSIYTTYGIDKTPPEITSDLRSAPYASEDVTLSGQAVDGETGTESVELRVDSGSYSTIGTGTEWSTSRTLDDGSHEVTIRVTDAKGNTRTASETIRVSASDPSVSTSSSRIPDYVAPGGEATVGFDYDVLYPEGATVRIEDDGTTIASTEVTDLDGGATAETATVTLPSDLPDGEYDVVVTIEDEATRTDDTMVQGAVVVDSTPPVVDDGRVRDEYVNSSTPLRFEVDASDVGSNVSGVGEVSVVRKGSSSDPVVLDETDDNWEGSLSPAETAGTHSAVITVTDDAGNSNTTEVSYYVDNSDPSVAVSAPNFTRSPSISVTGSATDENLSSVMLISPNGSKRTVLSTDGQFDHPVEVEEGWNEIAILATDDAGNRAERRLDVGVDRTEPSGRLIAPGRVGTGSGPPATNETSPTLTFEVSDDLAGLNESATESSVTVDGSTVSATASRSASEVVVSPASLDPGSHVVAVAIVDRAGNKRPIDRTFLVDTTKPTLDTLNKSVTDGETIYPNDAITFRVTADDDLAGVGAVTASGSNLANESGTWRGDTAAPLRIGNRSMSIEIVDAAGNTREISSDVYVGDRQTIPVDDSGTVSADPPSPEANNVSGRLDSGGNESAGNRTYVDLTSGVTRTNPTGTPVPDEGAIYYPQFAFNDSEIEANGGSFELTLSEDELRSGRHTPDTIEFWVHNETDGTWEPLTGELVEDANGSLVYSVRTPHYSTFAVSSEVDDAAPSLALRSPEPGGSVATDELRISAAYNDTESDVNANATRVWLDGNEVSLDGASTLTRSGVVVSVPVSAGNHTVTVETADEYGNSRAESWNVTVEEPASTGARGGGGGGGSGGDDEPAEVGVHAFEDYVSVTVGDVPANGEVVVDLGSELEGDAGSITGIGLQHRFSPTDYRIEATPPSSDAPAGTPAVDHGGVEPVAYFSAEFIQTGDKYVDSASFTVDLAENVFPDGTDAGDAVAYQYVDGAWQEVTTEEGSVVVETDDVEHPTFAIAIEATESRDSTETETVTETSDGTNAGGDTTSGEETETQGPGFRVVVVLVALIITAVIRVRRR